MISVGFWLVFDLLTVTAAVYGRVMFPALEAPATVYPEMAARLLPAGVSGLFIVALLATIMSTLDSFLFLSGQTIGRDLTRIGTPAGIWLGAGLGVALVAVLPDVIGLWYALGTVVIPGLLIPVLGAYIPLFRVRHAAWLMAAASGTSLVWMLFLHEATGIEPFYPGMAVGGVVVVGTNQESLRHRRIASKCASRDNRAMPHRSATQNISRSESGTVTPFRMSTDRISAARFQSEGIIG